MPKLSCSESLVNSHLCAFLEENDVLQPQSDFRPAHSTISTITAVANEFVNWCDKQQHCSTLFGGVLAMFGCPQEYGSCL